MKDLSHKICIVTGANSGIGYAVAKGLLLRGAKVIMACRNPMRANEAKQRLIKETGSSEVEFIICDLSSLNSIQDFVKEFKAKYQNLDILCHCAGNISFTRTETSDGVESNFATNVLGPHYLSTLLLSHFSKDQPTHIINIAGEFHRFFKLDFTNLFYKKNFSPLRVGSISMLERIMLTYSLADEVKGTNILVNCFHPGNVKTEMMNKLPPVVRLFSPLLTPFQISPDEGADTCLWLTTQNVSGKYFIKRKVVSSSKASYDKEAQQKLHKICQQLFSERT